MAELGNIFQSETEASKIEVDIDWLDYAFIEKCSEPRKLKAILSVLESGKEGHYPDLIKTAEQKLLTVLPENERRRYNLLKQKVTPAEKAEAEVEINSWLDSAHKTDGKLLKRNENLQNKPIKPIRGKQSNDQSLNGNKSTTKNATVEDLIELKYRLSDDISRLLSDNQRKKIETIRIEQDIPDLNEIHRERKSNLEKIKGNESFKLGELDTAISCYTQSIAYCETTAAVWANRAMAFIRKELFDLAEADCTAAIALDPTYIKALSRRGLVRFKRGKYLESIADFKEALLLDPLSSELQSLLEKSKRKFKEVEGYDYMDEEDILEDIPIKTKFTSQSVESPPDEPIETIIPVKIDFVSDFNSLILPSSAHEQVLYGSLLRQDLVPSENESKTFVRIPIVSDSDSEDEETENETENEKIVIGENKEFRRIEISEDDSEDEDNEPVSEDKGVKESEIRKDLVNSLKDNGNKLMAASRYNEAVEIYSKALIVCKDLFPIDSIPLLNNRAQAYLLLEDYEASVKDCCEVINLEPKNLKALFRRANAYFGLKQYQSSFNDLTSILLETPENKQAETMRNEIIPLLKPTESKQESTEKRQKEEKDLAVAKLKSDKLKELGNQSMASRDYASAILKYTEAINEDPTNYAAFNNRALASLKISNFTSAEADATMVLDNCPGSESDEANLVKKALFRRAQAKHSLGKQIKLKSELESLSKAEKKLLEALSDLKDLLRLDPMNKTALTEKTSINTLLESWKKENSPNSSENVTAPTNGKDRPGLVARSTKRLATPSESSLGSSTKKTSSDVSAGIAEKKETTTVETPVKILKPTSSPSVAASFVVPSEPPKTTYELERIWRATKDRPELFAQYLKCFKKATYKKVVKETVSPDLISSIFIAVKDHMKNPTIAIKTLTGLSQMKGFSFTMSLVPEVGIAAMKVAFSNLENNVDDGKWKGDYAELKEIYKSYL